MISPLPAISPISAAGLGAALYRQVSQTRSAPLKAAITARIDFEVAVSAIVRA